MRFGSKSSVGSRLQTEFDKLKQKAVSKVRGGPQCARGRAPLVAHRPRPSAVPCRAGRFVCLCVSDDGVSTVEYGAGAIVPPPEGRHAVPPEDEFSGAMRAPDFRGMITSPGAVSVPTKGTPTKGTPTKGTHGAGPAVRRGWRIARARAEGAAGCVAADPSGGARCDARRLLPGKRWSGC